MNNNLRLIDYFSWANSFELWCDEYRDYDIYIIVFQNDIVDELEFETKNKWIKISTSVKAIVSWEWCDAILNNNVVKMIKHHVLKTWSHLQKRTIVVIFVALDLHQSLQSVKDLEKKNVTWRQDILKNQMSVATFKKIIFKKWRIRENNESGEIIDDAQNREVEAFLKPCFNWMRRSFLCTNWHAKSSFDSSQLSRLDS